MDKKQIVNYWDKRAESFSKDKQAELESSHATAWLKEIEAITRLRDGLKVLDIGTGAGFLAILCAQQGAEVSGIDLAPDMIQSAKQNAQQLNQNIQFKVMDAEHLNYENETFDVVIARNVTWLMPNTQATYKEWLRVLKPNGHLINIDGNYGKDSFINYGYISTDHAHNTLEDEMLQESEIIKQSIPINHQSRPQYDINILKQLGYQNIHLDTGVYARVYKEQDAFYNPTPIFLISVTKPMT
ncbi:class I SAM-dependent methyltransferase [Staphylococcus equorum]|uniref:class I SAM-dependent methyltransferase n=1 Tax=Staphylococcus TaxID=1279 RepID=UPI0002820396|nr:MULTISPECIES: class I SAM-dependent methyltransferase [Staphylococcus]EJX18362.1 SAM-dependent methyltransferase [Staphylococcus sp. OJ82]MDK9860554.1 class I SAM-dependent methyltransferase [Staphylococcus equorum]QPS99262.1 class I SAM-dependent methyltransferase [Staphylococcus equorum]